MSFDHPLYSCDDHLDLSNVPPTVWWDRLPAKLRDQGPRVVERDGEKVWMAGDVWLGRSGRLDNRLTALGRMPELEDDGFRPADPVLRLQDMERDGIQASIVYGAGALTGFPVEDPEMRRLILTTWNDWAAEVFNAHAPDRLSALPFLPTGSPEEATAELERCAGLGHRGAIINPFDFDLKDDSWDRLWAAACAVDLPISFHIGKGTTLNPHDLRERAAFSSVVPLQMDEPLALMIFMGALERFPDLELVLAESGVGWLPYFVARMDDQFEKHCVPFGDECIQTKPSEIFARQIFATFEESTLR